VAAAANERYFARERQSIALPQLDGGVGPHDPLPVGGVQMDGNAAEGAAPFHHRGVVMRVGDRDAGKPAEPLHDLDGGGIDERDAVPQDIAFGRAHDERALADGKFRHRPDPDQAGLVLLIAIEVPARERIEGGPPLATGRNELTLVLTDRAGARRRIRRRKLAAASLADEGGHHTTRHVASMMGQRKG
jgi:hypothetical protein